MYKQKKLIEMMQAEIDREEVLIHRLKELQENAIDGWLITQRQGEKTYYLRGFRESGKTRAVAIPVDWPKQEELISELAAKSVARKGVPLLERNSRVLQKAVEQFRLYDPLQMPHGNLADAKVFYDGDSPFTAEEWESLPQSTYHSDARIHETMRGELVRSKSEVIIADRLFLSGIDYAYEWPRTIKGETVIPDFTIRCADRSLLLWEHFGLLSDSGYVGRALQKLQLYAQGGFHLGENLAITWETQQAPLTQHAIRSTMQQFGLPVA